jgi:hypothetical protein
MHIHHAPLPMHRYLEQLQEAGHADEVGMCFFAESEDALTKPGQIAALPTGNDVVCNPRPLCALQAEGIGLVGDDAHDRANLPIQEVLQGRATAREQNRDSQG